MSTSFEYIEWAVDVGERGAGFGLSHPFVSREMLHHRSSAVKPHSSPHPHVCTPSPFHSLPPLPVASLSVLHAV